MEIVSADHSGGFEDVLTDGVEVDVLRRRLEEDIYGVTNEQPGARKDEQRDENRP